MRRVSIFNDKSKITMLKLWSNDDKDKMIKEYNVKYKAYWDNNDCSLVIFKDDRKKTYFKFNKIPAPNSDIYPGDDVFSYIKALNKF